MKNLIIILSLFFVANNTILAQDTKETSKTEVKNMVYTCPMHPDEKSAVEGGCSKCGMKMVKTSVAKHDAAIKGSQTKRKVSAKYVCTMDGATSDKPGKCPKCGMNMQQENVKKPMYACPMHPNEISAIEGGCNTCGMKMVKTSVSKHDASIKSSQTKRKVSVKYVCTMDGATSDKPGKCPKCGMDMTAKDHH
ncbi:heavy metal-binding domain-containing protein [Flavobacterium sp. RSSA_27]|uniref:heavy metal-binding domain-containing protein n=1 Tax=Flavobacterium sp. RSSA_27 TaxID=3447667 RepID=UPI003F2F3F24